MSKADLFELDENPFEHLFEEPAEVPCHWCSGGKDPLYTCCPQCFTALALACEVAGERATTDHELVAFLYDHLRPMLDRYERHVVEAYARCGFDGAQHA